MSFVVPFAGLVAGFIVCYTLRLTVPFVFANYLAVAVLATIDSVLGGWRAGTEHRFDKDIFVSGFFMNAIAAGLLAFFGDKIGVSMTMAATIVFGIRIFNNLSLIRTHWILSRQDRSHLSTSGNLDGSHNNLVNNTNRRIP